MRTPNILQSMRAWFERFLNHRNKFTPPARRLPKSEDEVEERAYRARQDEIVVMEIEQVEFVQEWSRSVANESMTHAQRNSDQAPVIERRLPFFERRQPGHDRRAGDFHDRRRGRASRVSA